MVMLLWQNMSGIRVGEYIPISRFNQTEREADVRGPLAGQFLPTYGDCIVKGLNYPNIFADLRFVPDKSSLVNCPWNAKLGLSFVNITHVDGSPFSLCPRTILKNVCNELFELGGYECKAGIEIEFILFKGDTMETFENNSYMSLVSLMKLEEDFMEITN